MLWPWLVREAVLTLNACCGYGVKILLLALQDANLWDVSSAPTIVMTQRGARKEFQESLRAKGVEVVQFDFLTPEAVAAYCQERGFLQVCS